MNARPLLETVKLHASPVVANNAMNRQRGLMGANGYGRDLGLAPLEVLAEAARAGSVAWVDLCCGTGSALVQAAACMTHYPMAHCMRIEGIDLVEYFEMNPWTKILSLTAQSVEAWQPAGPYDLVTCVHGLHYVGDKLAAVAKAVGTLAPHGLFAANIDLANFRFADGKPGGRTVAARLRRNGIEYDSRLRVIRCTGPREIDFGLRYLGADDTAGPNYTGQAAVDSYYEAS